MHRLPWTTPDAERRSTTRVLGTREVHAVDDAVGVLEPEAQALETVIGMVTHMTYSRRFGICALLALTLIGCATSARCDMPSPWKAWQPIAVRGREARVWGRDYRLDEIGLPAQITSAGDPRLAGAASLDIAADGQAVRWTRTSGH